MHCIRASVVTSLDEKGFKVFHIMATMGHKSENSIQSYANKCPEIKMKQMSDALASNLIPEEPRNKMIHNSGRENEENITIAIPTCHELCNEELRELH